MFDFESFESDLDLEVGGVWVPIGEGAEILVAREGNEKYQDFLQGLVAANRALLDGNDKASRTLQKNLLVRAYAKHILLGARGIRLKIDGKVIDLNETNFNEQIATFMLKNKDFMSKVQGYAQQFEVFRKKGEEEALGNLSDI